MYRINEQKWQPKPKPVQVVSNWFICCYGFNKKWWIKFGASKYCYRCVSTASPERVPCSRGWGSVFGSVLRLNLSSSTFETKSGTKASSRLRIYSQYLRCLLYLFQKHKPELEKEAEGFLLLISSRVLSLSAPMTATQRARPSIIWIQGDQLSHGGGSASLLGISHAARLA